MTKEEIEELEILIPSDYMRKYIIETGWTFTDEQKAVLLVYGGLPLKEQHSRLQVLQKKPLIINFKTGSQNIWIGKI